MRSFKWRPEDFRFSGVDRAWKELEEIDAKLYALTSQCEDLELRRQVILRRLGMHIHQTRTKS